MIRLTVIASDFAAAANIGGGIETRCKTFDLPKEIADYIENQRGTFTTVALGVELAETAEKSP